MKSAAALLWVISALLLWLAGAQSKTDTCPSPGNNTAPGTSGVLTDDESFNITQWNNTNQPDPYTNQLDELAYVAKFHPLPAFAESVKNISFIPDLYSNVIGCACNSSCISVTCCDAEDGHTSAECLGTVSDHNPTATDNSTNAGSDTGTGTAPASSSSLAAVSGSGPSTSDEHCKVGNVCTSWWGCGDAKYCQCLQLTTNALWYHCVPTTHDKRDLHPEEYRGLYPDGRERFNRQGGSAAASPSSSSLSSSTDGGQMKGQEDATALESLALNITLAEVEAGPQPCNCSYVSLGCRGKPPGGIIHESPGKNLGMVQLPDDMCCDRATGEAQAGSHVSATDMSCFSVH